MNYPVVEQIAQAIEAQLKTISTANGYQVTPSKVVRPTQLGTPAPDHMQIRIEQQDPSINDEYSGEGNPAIKAWDQPYAIQLFVRQSEKDSSPVQTLVNVFRADVEKALTDSAVFPYWNDLAVNSEISAPEAFITQDGGYEGVEVVVTVTYRTRENNPYETA